MSKFSIQALRDINQFHLLAVGIDPKVGSNWADKTDGVNEGVIPQGQTPWKVSFYATSGVSLDGQIEFTNPMASIGSSLLNNKIVRAGVGIATNAFGIAPQIDYARKFTYGGSKPLEFTVQGCLALESDPQTDYFTPIEKLAYLTYPERLYQLQVDDIWRVLDAVSTNWFGAEKPVGTAIKNAIGGLYQNAFGEPEVDKKTGAQTDASKSKGWESLKAKFNEIFGKAFLMKSPPTFYKGATGSGLDFRYGKMLISDVYISSFKVDFPTLYYEGGLPALIPITLSLGTFRPVSSNLMTQIMQGIPQQWDDSLYGQAPDDIAERVVNNTAVPQSLRNTIKQ